jgi:pimeloyl-ACP methyl ester carboxylesterase
VSLPGTLIDLPPGRLFIHRSGEGPPLVLIHGYLVSHYYFKPVIAELAKRFEVIAIDLFGHGESDRPSPDTFGYDLPALADSVAAALDKLGIARARVWGHSMGGGVALTFAARHPDKVERLLLEDATVYPLPLPLQGRIVLLPLVGKLLFDNLYSRREFATFERSAYRDPALFDEAAIDYYWERFNRAGGRAALYALLKHTITALDDQTGDPARVKAPTLIVWGEEDRIVPLAHGERLAKAIQGARLEVVKACGHVPHEEGVPALLAAAVPFLVGAAGGAVGQGA